MHAYDVSVQHHNSTVTHTHTTTTMTHTHTHAKASFLSVGVFLCFLVGNNIRRFAYNNKSVNEFMNSVCQ